MRESHCARLRANNVGYRRGQPSSLDEFANHVLLSVSEKREDMGHR